MALLIAGCTHEPPPPSLREQLEESAKNGNAEAMVRLSSELCCGIGEGKDEERAVTWACQAARAGHPDAAFTLGRMYQENGLPLAAQSIYGQVRVKKDNSVAYAWYYVAAMKHHRLATTYLELLKRNMNNTQMDQAETLALDPRTIPCQYQGQTL